MARTVSVKLAMDVADYKHGATAATQDTKSLVDQLHDAARASDKTAMAMARTGAEAENAKRGVKNLAGGFDSLDRQLHQTDAALEMVDVQIGKTRREIELLALQAAATGDVDVFKSLRAKRGELGMQSAVRKELTATKGELETQLEKFGRFFAKTGEDAGIQFANQAGTGMLGALKVLPPEAQAVLIGAVTLAVAAAAPMLGAMIGGLVLTGIGSVGIGVGIVGALKDPRIQQAGREMAAELAADFKDETSAFILPTLKGISVIRDSLHGLKPDLSGIFTLLSSQVAGVAKGLGGLIASTMPGLKDAVGASLPLLSTLSKELPQIGRAFSDMFASIASGGNGAQQGMQALFDLVETMIRNLGTSIGFLEKAWSKLIDIFATTGHGMESVIGWVPVLGDHLKSVTGYYDHLKQSLADNKNAAMAAGAVGAVSDAVTTLGGTAKGAVQQMQDLRAELDKIQKSNFDARSSQRALEAAIDDGTKALQTNGRTLNVHTAEGRANGEALDAIALKANAAAEGIFAQTGSQEQANAVLRRGREAFINLAVSMSASTAEANRLADMLFTIPNRTVTIGVRDAAAQAAINRVQQSLGKIHDKWATVHVGVFYTDAGLHLPGGTQVRNERGGVYEHAASGLLREAATYSPQGPARYAFAEPSTGGEAFIPKRGDMARSRSIWGYVGENWLGMQRAPQYMTAGGGGGGGARPVVNVYVTPQPGNGHRLTDELVKTIRYVVRTEGGGDVQVALGDS